MKKRDFFKALGGTAIFAALFTAIGMPSEEINLRRPPGALIEPLFQVACVRCGKCVEACPQNIIMLLPLTAGLSNARTPVLKPRGVCIRDLACVDACPSGALQKITVEELDIGTAIINEEKCIGCGICIDVCSEIVNAPKWKNEEKVVIDPEICIGCGACVPECPVDAITLTPEGAARTTWR